MKNPAANNPPTEPKVMTYVVVSFVNNTSSVKVPTDGVETAKKIIDEIYEAANKGNIYYNKERGLIFKGSELNHAILAVVQS